MWEAMRIVADSAREHGTGVQMRTTVWPDSVVERTLGELQNATRDLGYELHIHCLLYTSPSPRDD